jgi:hypothetical protein
MEVIRDWKQLKTIVDPNYTYTVMGISKGMHLFNHTHEHMFKYSVGKAQKMCGVTWDNFYDKEVFNGLPATPAIYDDAKVINWFTNKGFDYLFIPDTSFIHELLEFPLYQDIRSEIEQIWVNENYGRLMGNYGTHLQINWMKMLLARQLLLYTDRSGSKYINRTYQPMGPDGNYGVIHRHFWKKYCGIDCAMVPLLREPNGLPFNINEVGFPQDVKDLFVLLVPAFNQFRLDHDITNLKTHIDQIISHHSSDFKFHLFSICDEITMNKYLIEICVTRTQPKEEEKFNSFRFWEYDVGI